MRPGSQTKPPEPSDLEALLRRPRVLATIGVSDHTFGRVLAAGTFPLPDLRIGRLTPWRPSTVWAWIDTESDRQRREVA